MTVDQRRRLQLYEVARERFGPEAADTLMELLPPMDPADLATKQDLAVLGTELRGEMSALRAELKGDVKHEISSLRAEMHELFREQTNRQLMFILPTMLSAVGLAFAATHL